MMKKQGFYQGKRKMICTLMEVPLTYKTFQTTKSKQLGPAIAFSLSQQYYTTGKPTILVTVSRAAENLSR